MFKKFLTLTLIMLAAGTFPAQAKKKHHDKDLSCAGKDHHKDHKCKDPKCCKDKRDHNCCELDEDDLNCNIGHPLDPLTCDEILAVKAVVDVLPEKSDPKTIYTDILLLEPKKAAVKKFEKLGGNFSRKARVILYNNATAETWEIIVAVCGGTEKAIVKSVKKLCGVIPNMNRINDYTGTPRCPPGSPSHFPTEEIVELVVNCPKLIEALKEAGYEDPIDLLTRSNPQLLPVVNTFESFRTKECNSCCPETITADLPHHRYFPITFSDLDIFDPFTGDFFSIVNGVEAVFDVTAKKIVAVIVTNPTKVDEFVDDPIPVYEHKHCLRPLETKMPQGPSFCVKDNVVTWDNWEFRLSWHSHSGLQLYNIKYFDSEKDDYRSILYKASLTEAIVSYNVGSEILFARNYLSGDTFHYPWMRRFTPICPGRDVPCYATLLNMYLADTDGRPVTFENSVAIYEQDGDILWRSATPNLDTDVVRGLRGRQLVVRTIFQGLYYLWIVSWIFNQDGTISVGIDVGGRTQNIIVPVGGELPGGELIALQELSLNHLHTYNFRLDFDVDGLNNSIIEENQFTVNNRKENPCGQFVDVREKVLDTEKGAIRDMNLESNRQWIIINPNKTNRLGHNVGYELLPLKNGFSRAADYSNLHQQFSFLKHHLHVTRHDEDEQFAAGDMPILQDHDTGLGAFVKDNEDIENKDIVVWYTINFAHVPHAEDYPFITLYRQGFSMVPHNFFESNPSYIGGPDRYGCTPVLADPPCGVCVIKPEVPCTLLGPCPVPAAPEICPAPQP